MDKYSLIYAVFLGFAVAELLQLIPILMSVLVGGAIIVEKIYSIRQMKRKEKNDRRGDI